MKADLTKPHIYVDGVAVNTEVAKNAHELLEILKCIIEKEKTYNLEIPLILHEPFLKAEQAIKKSKS